MRVVKMNILYLRIIRKKESMPAKIPPIPPANIKLYMLLNDMKIDITKQIRVTRTLLASRGESDINQHCGDAAYFDAKTVQVNLNQNLTPYAASLLHFSVVATNDNTHTSQPGCDIPTSFLLTSHVVDLSEEKAQHNAVSFCCQTGTKYELEVKIHNNDAKSWQKINKMQPRVFSMQSDLALILENMSHRTKLMNSEIKSRVAPQKPENLLFVNTLQEITFNTPLTTMHLPTPEGPAQGDNAIMTEFTRACAEDEQVQNKVFTDLLPCFVQSVADIAVKFNTTPENVESLLRSARDNGDSATLASAQSIVEHCINDSQVLHCEYANDCRITGVELQNNQIKLQFDNAGELHQFLGTQSNNILKINQEHIVNTLLAQNSDPGKKMKSLAILAADKRTKDCEDQGYEAMLAHAVQVSMSSEKKNAIIDAELGRDFACLGAVKLAALISVDQNNKNKSITTTYVFAHAPNAAALAQQKQSIPSSSVNSTHLANEYTNFYDGIQEKTLCGHCLSMSMQKQPLTSEITGAGTLELYDVTNLELFESTALCQIAMKSPVYGNFNIRSNDSKINGEIQSLNSEKCSLSKAMSIVNSLHAEVWKKKIDTGEHTFSAIKPIAQLSAADFYSKVVQGDGGVFLSGIIDFNNNNTKTANQFTIQTAVPWIDIEQYCDPTRTDKHYLLRIKLPDTVRAAIRRLSSVTLAQRRFRKTDRKVPPPHYFMPQSLSTRSANTQLCSSIHISGQNNHRLIADTLARNHFDITGNYALGVPQLTEAERSQLEYEHQKMLIRAGTEMKYQSVSKTLTGLKFVGAAFQN